MQSRCRRAVLVRRASPCIVHVYSVFGAREEGGLGQLLRLELKSLSLKLIPVSVTSPVFLTMNLN